MIGGALLCLGAILLYFLPSLADTRIIPIMHNTYTTEAQMSYYAISLINKNVSRLAVPNRIKYLTLNRIVFFSEELPITSHKKLGLVTLIHRV